jgi:hypothetical protein
MEAHFLNPAVVPFTKGTTFDFAFQEGALTTGSPFNTYAVTIVDNEKDNLFAAGLGFVQRRQSLPGDTLTDQDISVSMGYALNSGVGLGIFGHKLTRSANLARTFSKFNMGVGSLFIPIENLGVAVVGYDLLNDEDQDLVPSVGVGAHYIIFKMMRLRADVTRQEKRNPDRKGAVGLGMELDLSEGFYFRTGFQWDDFRAKNYWTGGAAWQGPRLSVAYAIKLNTLTSEDTTHTFQAWLAF